MTMKQEPLNLQLVRYTPKWAYRQRARRRLVIAMYGIPSIAIGSQILFPSLFSSLILLVSVIPTLICWAWVVGATRAVGDMPDEYLDERERSTRDTSYRLAYAYFTGAIVLLGLYVYFAVDAPRLGLPLPTLSSSSIWFPTLLYSALSLPSAMFAWLEPDPVED